MSEPRSSWYSGLPCTHCGQRVKVDADSGGLFVQPVKYRGEAAEPWAEHGMCADTATKGDARRSAAQAPNVPPDRRGSNNMGREEECDSHSLCPTSFRDRQAERGGADLAADPRPLESPSPREGLSDGAYTLTPAARPKQGRGADRGYRSAPLRASHRATCGERAAHSKIRLDASVAKASGTEVERVDVTSRGGDARTRSARDQARTREGPLPARLLAFCWIYFVQAESGPIKIGRTDQEPRERLMSLQSANHERLTLLAAYRDAEGAEKEWHAEYRAQRIRGEWFRSTADLLDEIAEIPDELRWNP